MKLLVQGDDFGMSYGITDGICLAAREGILTCTGLMTNFEGSEYAANRIKEYEHICVGQDINLFAGKSVTDPKLVPHLVDNDGFLISSSERKKTAGFPENDPFPYDETLLEVENQYKKFVELMGRKPRYLQGHSYLTKNISRAIREIAEKYNITYSQDIWKKIKMYDCHWLATSKSNFPIEEQLQIDVEKGVYDQLENLMKNDIAYIICHPGFLDEDLFSKSTYTAIRYKDLHMLLSKRIKEKLIENNVQLISYDDI